MYRFFVDRSAIDGKRAVVAGDDAHHIKNVLRLKKGEAVLLSCKDEWEYTCEITGFTKSTVETIVTDVQRPARELPSRITLYQCLPKKDKLELIIQKSVELGAFCIVPVSSSRCVTKIDPAKAEHKLQRWNEIARAAAKQSMRMIEPEVLPTADFKEAVREAVKSDVCLIPYEMAQGMEASREILCSIRPGQSVSVIIGPEGGFCDEEVEYAVRSGARTLSLGNRILRTETAGIAVLSILMFLLEKD